MKMKREAIVLSLACRRHGRARMSRLSQAGQKRTASPENIARVGRLAFPVRFDHLEIALFMKTGNLLIGSQALKYAFSVFLIGLATLTTFAAVQPDTEAVKGNWVPAKAELGGQPMSEALLQTISLKLEAGLYVVSVGGQPDKGTYTINPSTNPKSMTITGTDGPNRGKTFPAIYEVARDTLRICYDLSGTKRPTEFKTVPGTKLYLVDYKRKKQ
jgi:uncharacterized protein (TIGR03067 family)